MVQTGSVRLLYGSRGRGVRGCHNNNNNNPHSCVVGKRRLHMVSINLPSHTLGACSLHLLSSSIRGPIGPVSSRCKVFLCRSVFIPNGGIAAPALKSAALILTKSFDALRGSPLMVKLIQAVAIVAFAVWGLDPLIRIGRIIVFQRTDSTWKKSRSHYAMTSYIQPLMLWGATMLVCRALDPVVLPSEASQAVKRRLVHFIQSLSSVLAFAYCISSLNQQAQKFFAETNDPSDSRNMGFNFAGKAVYSAVWVAAVSLFMELLGFSTQKWVTAGGLGTVLLTLAGREIFTNFLSSVMIHATQPFVVNEWIQTKIEGYEVSGTVEHVGWWSPTIIRGDDREAVHIPNHKFTVNVVRNLSQKTHWRIKNHIAISHLDVHKINIIVADMRKVLAKNPQVEQQRLHRRVFLDNINPENQALMILISCFVKTSRIEEYLCVKEAILLDLLRVVSHHRARLATPIRTVRKVYGDADMENVPFADTIFGSSTVHTNRPYLLIEPSYRINSDDKSKASNHSARPNEDKEEAKPGSTPNPTQTEDKAASTSNSNTSPKTSEMPTSEPQTQNETTKYEGMEKEKGIDSKDESPEKVTPKTPVTSSEMSGGQSESPLTTVQAKQDGEKPVASSSTAHPSLEENIVLGVALEGSKRTLPIEEDTTPSSTESKGFTAINGSGGSIGTDMKD